MVDNIGMPVSGINMTYNNTGTIGPQDGDIQIKLTRGPRGRPPTTCASCASELPRALPGRHLLLPAGRHHQPDPEFRRARADRRAGARLRPRRRTSSYANELLRRASARCRAWPTRASSSRVSAPVFNVDVDRTRAQYVGLTDARRHQLAGRQPRRLRPGRADLLAQSGQRRVLLDRDADAAVPARFARPRCRTCRSRRRRRPRCRCWAASPTSRRDTAQRRGLAVRPADDGPDLRRRAGPRPRRRRRRRRARSSTSWRPAPRPRSARSRCTARSRPWRAPSPACCSACSARSC